MTRRRRVIGGCNDLKVLLPSIGHVNALTGHCIRGLGIALAVVMAGMDHTKIVVANCSQPQLQHGPGPL